MATYLLIELKLFNLFSQHMEKKSTQEYKKLLSPESGRQKLKTASISKVDCTYFHILCVPCTISG